jgi:hypothetical protein
MNGEAGKGDAYRPVDKEKYDRGYLRIFGIRCPVCQGGMRVHSDMSTGTEYDMPCYNCGGIGFIRKGSDGTGQQGSSAV